MHFTSVVVSTTSDWDDAIAFYLDYGFRITHRSQGRFGGSTNFVLDLARRRTAELRP